MNGGGMPFAGDRPVLVVRALVEEAILPRFLQWYRTVHRPNMLTIPGVTAAHAVTSSGRRMGWLMVLEFAEGCDIHGALQSPQAQRARDAWAPWADHVRGLSIEVYAPLGVRTAVHQWN